ncbi:MAG: hypothetical protein HC857_01245 [Synechococcales cyanobacterium RU_4_20]|nr:hypothetical protein [Synechococcales cyanobacterium RU_4_20]
MRFWLISFGLLFAAAKLLAWFQQFQLPLSAFVAGGVALAIASNYDKRNVFSVLADSNARGDRAGTRTPTV